MSKAKLFRVQSQVHEATIYGTFVNICMILFFSTCSVQLFAANVEISRFDTVSTNASTNITVTLITSPVIEGEVCLSLRSINGTGDAVFLPGGHTSTNISQTSILRITGNQLSSLESNMVLEAKVGEKVVASNIFTVVDAVMNKNRMIETIMPMIKDKVKAKEVMITRNQAIELATAAIKDKMKIQEGAPITVELKGRDYIVTFGYVRPNSKEYPGWRGPDFIAKVTLDAYTGYVKNGIQRGR